MRQPPAGGGFNTMDTIDLLMLASAVIGLTILMRGTFRRVTSVSSSPRKTARSDFAKMEQERRARHDVEQVMIELDHLARQIHGQLDTRFAKLEIVIRDADRRIEELTRLLQASPGSGTLDITVQDEEKRPPAKPPAHQDGLSPHSEVYRLADSGMPVLEIAQNMGKTTGEIDLILALRRAKQSPSGETVSSAVGHRS